MAALDTTPAAARHTAFRLAEKHFKNRATAALPALRGLPAALCTPVLDLSRPDGDDTEDDEVWSAGWWGNEYGGEVKASGAGGRKVRRIPKAHRERGERPAMDTNGLRAVPLHDGRVGYVVAEGCILIPRYLSPSAQTALLLAALAEHTLPPNPLSLTTHYALPPDLFAAWVADETASELDPTAPPTAVLPVHASLDQSQRDTHAAVAATANGPRATVETDPAATLGYAEVQRRNAAWTGDSPSLQVKPRSPAQLLRELRWANLGWVYRWTTKSYDFSTDEPIPFPRDVRRLCCDAVGSVPWGEVFGGGGDGGDGGEVPDYASWADDYEPDTGIVNYYQLNDTLMAHVDRSELDNSRPLVSVSVGHACVFLLGSASRHDSPRPIVLRSGDVLVMAGKGRQAYHGVPRIMEDTLPAHFTATDTDSPTLRAAKRWVQTARVNINARQVFPPGFQRAQAATFAAD